MAKFYFEENDERCYTLDYFKWYMKKYSLKYLKLREAKIEYGNGFFFCTKYSEIGESGENCGKVCEHYQPRNGKNGLCKFWRNTYEPTDKIKILTL